MRVAIIGAHGNMGRRYSAIVRYLGHEVLEHDPLAGTSCDLLTADYQAAIIASPIDTHVYYCLQLACYGKPFLCEKPISKDVAQVRRVAEICYRKGTPGYMVNNWAYALDCDDPPKPKTIGRIHIDCYNTGDDGAWDLIQPLWLVSAPDRLTVRHKSPALLVACDKGLILRDAFDWSYKHTVEAFLLDECYGLWPIDADIVTAHERVLEYEQRQQAPSV